ncbi:MAG: DUF1156 domain-containing protein [Deltaproteobacteria bacterium]|jgi:putative DNA methylase|nr:DUF1156 domain-containing protein [Deltaproteobacteria bacterium]
MKKKLIEVALPLIAINKESSREKSLRHGHPSTFHLWWSRKPLATARAVLFASLVDDPSARPDLYPTLEERIAARNRLFKLIEELIVWENSTNQEVLARAKEKIQESCGGSIPELLDPFAGGGSIPLEGQRLGLKVHAFDLNPVAVTINKAMVEIPPKFSGWPAINPNGLKLKKAAGWGKALGLAEDVAYYAAILREKVFKKVGHLYPTIEVTDQAGVKLDSPVLAWIFARTVKCPNPACGVMAPLVSSFSISPKGDYVEPTLEKGRVVYQVKNGGENSRKGTMSRKGAKCVICHSPISLPYIREEGRKGRLASAMMAIVTKNKNGRSFVSPSELQEKAAAIARIALDFDLAIPSKALGFNATNYGLTNYSDLFTPRQLIFLTTLGQELTDLQAEIEKDALKAGLASDDLDLASGGLGAKAYSQAVIVYLSFIIDKMTDRHSNLCSWDSSAVKIRNLFSRPAISIVWDYAEGNPFSTSTGSLSQASEWIVKALKAFPADRKAEALQADAQTDNQLRNVIISTDPPYYDNIGYADLSDYFYIWLRPSLRKIYKSIFSTIKAPKNAELVADPFRFGGKAAAKELFESGLKKVFSNFYQYSSDEFPLTIYYAFKQKDLTDKGSKATSSGWETMLAALIEAGLTITGAWPVKSELGNRTRALDSNALASSIVLVCRKRPLNAKPCSRRDFINHLRVELKSALKELRHANIAPVDLAQAAIGPGMAIYSRYSKIVETDGSTLSVKGALALINEELNINLADLEGSLDPDSWLCLNLFSQFKFAETRYGEVDIIARARNANIERLVEKKIVFAKKGKFRLLSLEELPTKIAKGEDNVWLLTHQLTYALKTQGLEACAKIALAVENDSALAKAHSLAYVLFKLCEEKTLAALAFDYNALIQSWPAIQLKIIKIQSEAAKPRPNVLPGF